MIKNKKVFKRIAVEEWLYDRLIEDREEFQKTIGGGNWTITDTINEYIKILKIIKDEKNI